MTKLQKAKDFLTSRGVNIEGSESFIRQLANQIWSKEYVSNTIIDVEALTKSKQFKDLELLKKENPELQLFINKFDLTI